MPVRRVEVGQLQLTRALPEAGGRRGKLQFDFVRLPLHKLRRQLAQYLQITHRLTPQGIHQRGQQQQQQYAAAAQRQHPRQQRLQLAQEAA